MNESVNCVTQSAANTLWHNVSGIETMDYFIGRYVCWILIIPNERVVPKKKFVNWLSTRITTPTLLARSQPTLGPTNDWLCLWHCLNDYGLCYSGNQSDWHQLKLASLQLRWACMCWGNWVQRFTSKTRQPRLSYRMMKLWKSWLWFVIKSSSECMRTIALQCLSEINLIIKFN